MPRSTCPSSIGLVAAAALLVFTSLISTAAAQNNGNNNGGPFKCQDGAYPWCVHTPPGMESGGGKKWPTILFLPGSGARGSLSNAASLATYDGVGKIISRSSSSLAATKFITIIPIAPSGSRHFEPAKIRSVLQSASSSFPGIDQDRVSVTGYSMGSRGTWRNLVFNTDLFAAGAPSAGAPEKAGDGTLKQEAAPPTWPLLDKLKDMPIRAFAGTNDETAGHQTSEEAQKVLEGLGDSRSTLTLEQGATHEVMSTKPWEDDSLFEWFLQQSRSGGSSSSGGNGTDAGGDGTGTGTGTGAGEGTGEGEGEGEGEDGDDCPDEEGGDGGESTGGSGSDGGDAGEDDCDDETDGGDGGSSDDGSQGDDGSSSTASGATATSAGVSASASASVSSTGSDGSSSSSSSGDGGSSSSSGSDSSSSSGDQGGSSSSSSSGNGSSFKDGKKGSGSSKQGQSSSGSGGSKKGQSSGSGSGSKQGSSSGSGSGSGHGHQRRSHRATNDNANDTVTRMSRQRRQHPRDAPPPPSAGAHAPSYGPAHRHQARGHARAHGHLAHRQLSHVVRPRGTGARAEERDSIFDGQASSTRMQRERRQRRAEAEVVFDHGGLAHGPKFGS